MQVIHAVNSDTPCGIKFGHLVEDIKKDLQKFATSSFTHVRRNTNLVAHILAVDRGPKSLS